MGRNIDRRTALKLSGAATVAAVAGCSNPLNGGGNGSSGGSAYSQYLAVQDNQVFFAYADFKALEELDQNSEGGGGNNQMPNIEEPMLAPASAIFLIAFSAGFQLGALGLGGLLQTDSESELASSGDEVLIANSALVVAGEMDTDELDSRLTSSGDNSFKTQYEQTGESSSYTLYKPASSSASANSGSVVAVDGSTVISAQSESAVQAVIDAIGGSGRAVDEFSEFKWLLDNGGDGLIAIGGYGPNGYSSPGSGSGSGGTDSESSLDFVNDSGGFVGSMTFDGDNIISTIAASSDQITEEQQGAIESEFQSDRTDVSLDFKGDGRVVASATYSREVLQGGSMDGSN